MRLMLSGGGTGGHVYPALAIAAALQKELPDGEGLELLWVGSASRGERDLVERAGIPFRSVNSGPIRGRSPWELATNGARIGIGALQSQRLLNDFRPQAVLSTGGYAGFPLALAARAKGVPLVVYLPDIYPGWAVQGMARLARRVAVTAPQTLRHLPDGKAVVTGYPVRPAFWEASRRQGRQRLGLDAEEKVLLVAGASQGAHSINQAMAHNLPGLLELCEVIHLSGRADETELARLRSRLPDHLRWRYHLFGYLHEEVPWAMAAADLAVCRAGASVMGELPALGLPAVLVPYPYAGGHQKLNARYLEEAGAAVTVEDRNLLRELLPLVGQLLHDEQRLRAMAAACRQLARPDAAASIARILLEVAKG